MIHSQKVILCLVYGRIGSLWMQRRQWVQWKILLFTYHRLQRLFLTTMYKTHIRNESCWFIYEFSLSTKCIDMYFISPSYKSVQKPYFRCIFQLKHRIYIIIYYGRRTRISRTDSSGWARCSFLSVLTSVHNIQSRPKYDSKLKNGQTSNTIRQTPNTHLCSLSILRTAHIINPKTPSLLYSRSHTQFPYIFYLCGRDEQQYLNIIHIL